MNKLFSTLIASLAALTIQAITPLWLRDVQISPNASEILFCYKGDIYKVSALGGSSTRLTTQASYECFPVWSPDGKQVAFASDRDGNMDIFIMSAEGGPAQKLTFNAAKETPWAFSPDGKYIYFSATIQDPAESALFPKETMTELYRVPVKGGRTEQVLGTPAEYICFDKQQKFFLYQDRKGSENEWRKHHTSSVTRDIWKYDFATGKHTNLTNRPGEDRQPIISEDGHTAYMISEPAGGTLNVYSFDINSPEKLTAVTNFKTHPVRFLSKAGETLCYTYDGEIYTQKTNGKPSKVKIDLIRDDENPIKMSTTSGSWATVSQDGKQIAFVSHGEVFVSSVDYITTKQITHTAAAEASPVFSPDGKKLVYASERNGHWQLWEATLGRAEDKYFSNATIIKEQLLLADNKTEYSHPSFSPDGKELAFIQDRCKLMVMDIKTKHIREVTNGDTWQSTGGGFEYDWSPDGKWFTLVYNPYHHDPYHNIGIVSAQGGPITDITGSGYICEDPKFVMGGNAIIFTTDRYGMRSHASWGSLSDLMIAFTNQDAYDKFRLSKEDYEFQKELEKEQKAKIQKEKKDKKESKDKDAKDTNVKDSVPSVPMELEGIEDRIVRLTPNSSYLSDANITSDGESLFYLSSLAGGYDLWKMNLRNRETKIFTKSAGSGNLCFGKDSKFIYHLGASMKRYDINSGSVKSISAHANFEIDPAKEREYMFNHIYLQEQKRFYNTNMHGINWDKMVEEYRKFLPHINNNYDFSEMLSELLGELNVSHTGCRYNPSLSSYSTASLGLLFDWKYKGDGLKVAEIVEKGPFHHKNTKLKAGCIIEKIDGIEITPEQDYTMLLKNKEGHKTLISIRGEKGEKWEEVVLPISTSAMSDLLYKRWVKQRTDDVCKWSNGRLGYVHIQSMNDKNFRNIYSDILGKFNKCEGIVIDTRFNGGGRLHEDVEILFSGKKYLTQVIRGRESCDMPSRRCNKPSIMLTCEANYSNAHGTPWVYKHTGIGKLVGAPVPGTMTTVSWETLQDNTLVFGIPIIGYQMADGNYLEGTQLEPDIYVLNAPDTIVKGEDTQLKTAVEELLKDLK